MIEDSDFNKIAEFVKKQRSLNRWYNDAEKAKRVGPLMETACYIFGLIAVFGILALIINSSSFDYYNEEKSNFINLSMEKLNCKELKEISLDLAIKDKSSPAFNPIRSNLDSQILARCV